MTARDAAIRVLYLALDEWGTSDTDDRAIETAAVDAVWPIIRRAVLDEAIAAVDSEHEKGKQARPTVSVLCELRDEEQP